MVFGQVIAEARKGAKLTLGELAERVRKEDGQPVSIMFLSEIERGHRSASDTVIEQPAEALNLPTDFLYFLAGKMPADIKMLASSKGASVERIAIAAAFQEFRASLQKAINQGDLAQVS